MPAWVRRMALTDIHGVSFDAPEEDPLYQILDKLHPHCAAIEAALIERGAACSISIKRSISTI